MTRGDSTSLKQFSLHAFRGNTKFVIAGISSTEKPTRGFEPRTPSLRVISLKSEFPCKLVLPAFADGAEPAVNPLLQRRL